MPLGPVTPRGYSGTESSGLVIRLGLESTMVTLGRGGTSFPKPSRLDDDADALAILLPDPLALPEAAAAASGEDPPPLYPGRVLLAVDGWGNLGELLGDGFLPFFFFFPPPLPPIPPLLDLCFWRSIFRSLSILCSYAASFSASIIFLDAERFRLPLEPPLAAAGVEGFQTGPVPLVERPMGASRPAQNAGTTDCALPASRISIPPTLSSSHPSSPPRRRAM